MGLRVVGWLVGRLLLPYSHIDYRTNHTCWSHLITLQVPITHALGHTCPSHLRLVTPAHHSCAWSHLPITLAPGHTCPSLVRLVTPAHHACAWSHLPITLAPGHTCPSNLRLVTPAHHTCAWSPCAHCLCDLLLLPTSHTCLPGQYLITLLSAWQF